MSSYFTKSLWILAILSLFAPPPYAQHSATVTWTQPAQPPSETVASTNVIKNSVAIASVPATVLTYTDTAVNPGDVVSYAVANVDTAGGVGTSPAITVTIPGAVVPPPALVFVTSTLPMATAGAPYNATLAASGGTPPYIFTSTGMPAGLALSSAGGISGTPTVAAAAQILATVTDAGNPAQTASAMLLLTINPATSGPLFSLWPSTTTPGHATGNDSASVELGVKFTSSSAGQIVGVRFYKATNSTGTHTGTLWSAAGAKLATGTFSGETASGWQTLTFATPIAITAGTSYVASYHTVQYSYDEPYAWPRTAAPLSAPAAAGVYAYGATSTFPKSTFNSTNYYADVLFLPGTPPPPAVTITIAPTSATVPVNGTVQFAATVTNFTNTAVTWSANAPGGLYTAPALSGTATVTATASADPTKSASAAITIQPPALTIACSTDVSTCNLSGIESGKAWTVTVTSGGRTATATGTKP